VEASDSHVVCQIGIFEETPGDLEEGVRHVREDVLPALRGANGLRAAYWLINRERGRRLALLFWESDEMSIEEMPKLLDQINKNRRRAGKVGPQNPPIRVERYEVFAQATTKLSRLLMSTKAPARRPRRKKPAEA
jgi:hypothetical protein